MNNKYIALTALLASILSFGKVYAQESDATNSAVRQIVQEKLEQAKRNPKAYLGALTDKTDSTLQIQNSQGEILQISVSDQTSFIKVNSKNQTASFDDIAIGDYIVAMGYLNTGTVLEGIRILITDEVVKTQRTAHRGKVTELSKSDFVLINGSETQTINYNRSTDMYDMDEQELVKVPASDLEEGYEILVSGAPDDDSFLARRIQIINKPKVENETSEEEN